MGGDIEQEIQEIVQMVLDVLPSISGDQEDSLAAALDIIRYLPVRTAHEVAFVLDCAQDVTDVRVQGACAKALGRVDLEKHDVRAALEKGRQSSVLVVREAVEKVLQG